MASISALPATPLPALPPCHMAMPPASLPVSAPDGFVRQSILMPLNAPVSAYKAQLLPPTTPIALGAPTTLYMRLQEAATGLPPQGLEIVHEKPVHMFLVSQDLSDFQHVHPALVAPGLLEIPATFSKTGPYSVFAQFKPIQQAEQTVSTQFQVPGPPMPLKPLQLDTTDTKTCLDKDQAGAMQAYTYRIVNLPSAVGQPIRFQVHVLKNGQPVQQIDPFLGAAGHAIIVSANHEAFAHAHAMDGMSPMANMPGCTMAMPMPHNLAQLNFESDAVIQRPGVYKAWIQTQVDGRVKTVDWTFCVPG